MPPVALGSALTCFFALFLSRVVCVREIDRHVRHAFFLMATTLSAWAGIAVLALTTSDHGRFALLFAVGSVFQVLHFGSFLHFCVTVTSRVSRRPRLEYAIYLPCIAAAALFVANTSYTAQFVQIDGVWQFNHLYASAAFVTLPVIWFGYYGLSAYLYARRSSTSASVREREVYKALVIATIVLVSITLAEVVLLPLFLAVPSRGLVVVFKLLWLLYFGYLMDRLRFLSPPARLEELALTEFPGGAVFVLDARRVVHHVNAEASRLIWANGRRPAGLSVDDVFRSADDLHECLDAGDFLSGGCRWATVEIGAAGDTVTSMDVAVSTIASDDGVVLGYLVVGDIDGSKPDCNPVDVLSPREREIVHEVVGGLPNGDIAERLGISERTVTTHTTRIFRKLGVHSRLELQTLLSHHSAQQ